MFPRPQKVEMDNLRGFDALQGLVAAKKQCSASLLSAGQLPEHSLGFQESRVITCHLSSRFASGMSQNSERIRTCYSERIQPHRHRTHATEIKQCAQNSRVSHHVSDEWQSSEWTSNSSGVQQVKLLNVWPRVGRVSGRTRRVAARRISNHLGTCTTKPQVARAEPGRPPQQDEHATMIYHFSYIR